MKVRMNDGNVTSVRMSWNKDTAPRIEFWNEGTSPCFCVALSDFMRLYESTPSASHTCLQLGQHRAIERDGLARIYQWVRETLLRGLSHVQAQDHELEITQALQRECKLFSERRALVRALVLNSNARIMITNHMHEDLKRRIKELLAAQSYSPLPTLLIEEQRKIVCHIP